MTDSPRNIAFKVEFSRILELLADQIYQSPMALLRENTQNAFDAIRMRQQLGDDFEPLVEIWLSSEEMRVSDNGIGMTAEEIEDNYWYAGKSGKNTIEARAAGVVGTFGIGAMANFGVATELSVVSESARVPVRTSSRVRKEDLSTDKKGIEIRSENLTGQPGTVVTAMLDPAKRIDVIEGKNYIQQFVEFVDVTVLFNGEKISGAEYRSVLPSTKSSWNEHIDSVDLAGLLSGDLEVFGMASGELRVVILNTHSDGVPGRPGSIVLIQGGAVIRTFRSGFGLATVGVPSNYQWGGVVDLPFLVPTAGREALEASSNQNLNNVIGAIDRMVSDIASRHHESFSNDQFLQWVRNSGRFELCGQLEVIVRPSGENEILSDVITKTGFRYYDGRDQSVIATYASEDEPLILISQRNPRRDCELGFLRLNGMEAVDVSPHVTKEFDSNASTYAQTALAIRITRLLEEDYFLATELRYGTISGGLPILVTERTTPVVIFLDPDSTAVSPLLSMYVNDFSAFTPFVKDFVRTTVFPRVSNLVPSSTKAGAESFLRHLRSNREWFEYELDDQADWNDLLVRLSEGSISLSEATERLTDAHRSVVEVTRSGTATIESLQTEIKSDPTSEQGSIDEFGPLPGIDRREIHTSARILTSDSKVNGYTCFLSLSDRVQKEKGDFFLQPHTTEVVWGGRKVIFIFQHHSGEFGLYYDILCPGLVGGTSGGGLQRSSTILTSDRTFIPIPQEIESAFLPQANERKKLEIRCDVLYLENLGTDPRNAIEGRQ